MATLLLLPLVGVFLQIVVPRRDSTLAWYAALATSFCTLLLPLSWAASTLPNAVNMPWIPAVGASFALQMDGAALLFSILTGLVFFLAILASPGKPATFYALHLVMLAAAYGFFLAGDALLLFLCFEAVLIPMYFLIGVWGSQNRHQAAFRFVLYTVLGSVALLLGILTLYLAHGSATGNFTFALAPLTQTALPWRGFAFAAIVLGFAVKVPMLPLHSWLPLAHTEAPTSGSVILAAILLKMGTYGLFRMAVPLLSGEAWSASATNVLLWLSAAAILYGGFAALGQTDAKRLVAYSSISHLGFCTLGLFSQNSSALSGSLLQQINHGISTSLLFFLVGFLYERRGTRDLAQFGGLAKPMPRLSLVFGIAMLGSAGLPLLNGFVGEFTILRGVFAVHPAVASFSLLGIILAAAYLLVLFQKTMLGPVTLEANRTLPDLRLREWLIVLPLLGWSIWIGISPGGHFRLLDASVAAVVKPLLAGGRP
ncbi:MAG: NADH-quinone oxidoreductase subunit M [Bryobacter sp.]